MPIEWSGLAPGCCWGTIRGEFERQLAEQESAATTKMTCSRSRALSFPAPVVVALDCGPVFRPWTLARIGG